MTGLVRRSGADSVADALVNELVDRLQAGGEDVETFIAAHPEHAEVLRGILPAARLMADLSGSSPADSAVVDAAGRPFGELGDFRLIREVGRGGMGVVYEAEQLSLGRPVALKVLPYAATMDAKHLQRFKNEARAAASLHHEHIVPVYGVGCERGVHYYAMQLIDGVSLAQMMPSLHAPAGAVADAPTVALAALTTEPGRPKGREFYRAVARLIADAAEALEHAHQLGIVHRDVKPGNLLLDESGKVWVTDFGLARFGPDAGLTMSGDMLGTLRYMAPEQALAKHGLVDHRADVYALGATLYELLTGRPAVDAIDRAEVLRRIAFEDPVSPRKLDKAIPAELETIASKCLAKDPAERYATAGEQAADLRRWLADRVIRAKPPTRARRAAKWAARHRAALLTAAAVLLLATAVVVAGLVWHTDRLRAEAANTARERDAAREEQQWAAQAVDDMYTQVAEQWLGPQPRLQPLQRTFLEKALAYYQRAAGRWGDDPAVRRKVSESYLRVGAINAALGRHGPAEKALRTAIAGLEASAAETPTDPVVRNNVLIAYDRLGQTLQATGRFPAAADAYQRQLDLATKLVADFPTRPELRSRPAFARQSRAFALTAAGRTGEAEAAYRDTLAELGRLSVEVRDRAEVRHLRVDTVANLGKLYFEVGRFGDAEPLFREAAAGFEQLVNESPGSTEYRHYWAYALCNLGATLPKLDRAAEARPVLIQAESVLRRLAADFPDLPDVLADLAAVQNNLGIMLRSVGAVDDAETYYRKAVVSYGTVAARCPSVPDYRSRLGSAQQNLANLLSAAGRAGDAETTLRGAVTTLQALSGQFPEVAAYRADLALALYNLGAVRARLPGRPAAAQEAYSRALGLQEQLLAAAPGNSSYRQALARTCNNLAVLLALTAGPPYPQAGRAVELAKRAVELEPRDPGRWRSLGLAQYRAGNWRESLAALEQARGPGSDDSSFGFVQAMARWQLGDRDAARRDYAAAVRAVEKEKTSSPPELLRLRDEAAELLRGTGPDDPTDKSTQPPDGGR